MAATEDVTTGFTYDRCFDRMIIPWTGPNPPSWLGRVWPSWLCLTRRLWRLGKNLSQLPRLQLPDESLVR
jgi:hypothetical protein